MTRVQTLSLAIGVALAALAVGWMAGRATNDSPIETTSAETSAAERTVIYYRHHMGLADTSPVPKKDSMGMEYVTAYAARKRDGSGKSVSVRVYIEGRRSI